MVRRSDGSGTTFNFTDYLSKVNADWKTKVGSGTAVEWPVGVGAKGNEGVAGNVGQTKNSIGYVEYAYAKQNKLTYARLINKAGKTVQPTIAAFQAAAANADWAKAPGYYVILTDQPGEASWPITAATFILMHKEPTDKAASARSHQVLQLGVREGRQDGRRARLHPDAGLGGQADREDLVGRHQELISQTHSRDGCALHDPDSPGPALVGSGLRDGIEPSRVRSNETSSAASAGIVSVSTGDWRGRHGRSERLQWKPPDLTIAPRRSAPSSSATSTFYWITRACAISVLLILGGIILSLIVGAWPAMQEFGFSFLFTAALGAVRPIRRCSARSARSTARW